MTRKHFEHLAKIVRWWTGQIESGIPVTPTVIAYDLAMFCKEYNPGFDYKRFMAACQPKKEA
jgi:hypothetical protein